MMRQAPGSHQCRECGGHFQNASNLSRHMKSKHSRQFYPCPVCGSLLSDRSNLKRHERHCSTRQRKNQSALRLSTEQLHQQAPQSLRLSALLSAASAIDRGNASPSSSANSGTAPAAPAARELTAGITSAEDAEAHDPPPRRNATGVAPGRQSALRFVLPVGLGSNVPSLTQLPLGALLGLSSAAAAARPGRPATGKVTTGPNSEAMSPQMNDAQRP